MPNKTNIPYSVLSQHKSGFKQIHAFQQKDQSQHCWTKQRYSACKKPFVEVSAGGMEKNRDFDRLPRHLCTNFSKRCRFTCCTESFKIIKYYTDTIKDYNHQNLSKKFPHPSKVQRKQCKNAPEFLISRGVSMGTHRCPIMLIRVPVLKLDGYLSSF